MSENKWTPGPWVWKNIGRASWVLWQNKGIRPVVLDCGPVTVWCGGDSRESVELRMRDVERDLMVKFSPDHPNARLISCAPDLYEACHKAWLKLDAEGDDLADELFAVLTKARGE